MKLKKALICAIILLLVLTACSVEESGWFIIGVRYVPDSTEPEITETVGATSTGAPATGTPTATVVVPTETPTNSPTATATLEPTPTREVLRQVTLTANVNLRQNPVSGSTVLTVIPSGTALGVFAEDGDYLQVTYQSFAGWIFNGSWVIEVVEVPGGNLNQRVGYNVLGVSDQGYALNHWLAYCPEYLLFMDALEFANHVEQTLRESCGTRVIHRTWHPSDGSEFLVRTPSEFVNGWVAEGYPNLIRYTTNEPSCYEDCNALIAHEIEIARLAREVGYTVVLANTGVGKFSPNAVTSGQWNPLVQAAIDYNHLLGFHEYTQPVLAFGFGQWPQEFLLDRNNVQPNLWPQSVPFEFAPFSSQLIEDPLPFGLEMLQAYYADNATAQVVGECGALPGYWHLARSFMILLWFECTTGIDTSTLEIVHTEFGWDRLGDIDLTMSQLRTQYGHPDYEFNLRGWRSHELLWNWYYPNWSTEQAAYEQLMHAVSMYPSNHHMLLFAWADDPNRDWNRWGFGFGNHGDPAAIGFHRLLEQ